MGGKGVLKEVNMSFYNQDRSYRATWDATLDDKQYEISDIVTSLVE
jgi:hypothetical protein